MHIEEEIWIGLKQDSISAEQYRKVLQHTGVCTGCAERFAAIVEAKTESMQINPPDYLKEEILQKVQKMDGKPCALVKKTSHRAQLLWYSFRVGTAVLASIFILAATTELRQMDYSQLKDRPSKEEVQQMEERPSREEVLQREENLLSKVNLAADALAERMNEFTSQLVNGGKRND